MKRRIIGLTLMLGLFITSLCYGADDIKITVDGRDIESDTPAQIVDGRTFVPLRAIFEALDAEVEWDGTEKSVTAKKRDTSIYMKIDEKNFKVNEEEKLLDVPAAIIDGRTMVPARAVSEGLGCDVEWDSVTRTVIVISKEEETTETYTELFNDEATAIINEKETETTTEQPVWIKHLMSEDKKPEPVNRDKLYSNERKEYHSVARHNFDDIFDKLLYSKTEDNIYKDLNDNNINIADKKIQNKIKSLWKGNMAVYYLNYKEEMETSSKNNDSNDSIEMRIGIYFDYFYKKLAINGIGLQGVGEGTELALEFDKNVGYSYTKFSDNAVVVLLSMADDEGESGLCSYIAVFINKDAEKLCYKLVENNGTFILKENGEIKEKGLTDDKLMFLNKINEFITDNEKFN